MIELEDNLFGEDLTINPLSSVIETELSTLRGLKREKDEAMSTLHDVMGRMITAQCLIDALKKTPPVSGDEILEEIKAENPDIERVGWKDNHLLIQMGEMVASDTDSDARIKISPHLIYVDIFNGGKSKFVCLDDEDGYHSGYNDDDGRDAMLSHPHVIFSTFEACLGDYAPLILDSFAERRYARGVKLILSFLKSFSSNDTAGRYYKNWEEA